MVPTEHDPYAPHDGQPTAKAEKGDKAPEYIDENMTPKSEQPDPEPTQEELRKQTEEGREELKTEELGETETSDSEVAAPTEDDMKTASSVSDYVGEDKAKAKLALDLETGKDGKDRVGVKNHLQSILDKE